jgi:hypothetical protein
MRFKPNYTQEMYAPNRIPFKIVNKLALKTFMIEHKEHTPDQGNLRTKEHSVNSITRKQHEKSADVHSQTRHAIVTCKYIDV